MAVTVDRASPVLVHALWIVAFLGCPETPAPTREVPPRNLAEHAERLGRRMSDSGARALLLAEIGAAFSHASRPEDAAPFLFEAQKLAPLLPVAEREEILAVLAEGQAIGGDLAAAERTAASIGAREVRSEALAKVVEKLALERSVADAAKVLPSIPDDEWRGTASVHVVGGLIALDRVEEAAKTARKITHAERRDEAIARVAIALFEARDLKRARGALEDLASPHWRGEAIAATARMRYSSGHRKDAEAIAAGIESHWIRARAYADLSGLAAAAGRDADAKRLLEASIDFASDIDDSVLSGTALADIGIRLVDRGRVEDALTVLAKTDGVAARRKADAHLAGWYARNERMQDAMAIHRALEADVIYGSEAATQIAKALAERGEFASALAVVARIRSQELRLPVLAAVAVRHVLAGAPLDDTITRRLEDALFATP